MDINEPILYKWTLGWDKEGMVNPNPTVNRLLKAMIEKNVGEMERLFRQGASLKKTDKETLHRVLYHVLDDYEVIACLVQHGFISYNGSFLTGSDYYVEDECWNPHGYRSGLPGRAWSLKSYKVVKLLVDNGFENMSFTAMNQFYNAERLCFQNNDIETIKWLVENGKPINHYDTLWREYPNSIVTQYLENIPIIKRRSLLLDPLLFDTIPEPELIKAGFFSGKAVKEKNARILANHEDRVAAQKRFIEKIGRDTWRKEIQKNEMFSQVTIDIARELKGKGGWNHG